MKKEKPEWGTKSYLKRQIEYLEKEIIVLSNAKGFFQKAIDSMKKEVKNLDSDNKTTTEGKKNV